MNVLGIRLFWLGLVILALYVMFVMFVADVGGDEPAIPQPTGGPASHEFEASRDFSLRV